MTATVATLREMLARLRRKAKGIDGPTAMILDGLIDLAATQQDEIAKLNARLAQRGAFQADVQLGPEPPAAQRLGLQACREADPRHASDRGRSGDGHPRRSATAGRGRRMRTPTRNALPRLRHAARMGCWSEGMNTDTGETT